MNPKYSNNETGWVFSLLLTGVCLFCLYQYIFGKMPLLVLVPLEILFVAIILLFYQLKVIVLEDRIRLIYGIGLIIINVRIDELIRTRKTKAPIYAGLGIRMMQKCMLYNINTLQSIEIDYYFQEKKDKVMIGSPDIEKLQQVIESTFNNESSRN